MPTGWKKLTGNKGGRPLPPDEPKPRPIEPECPSDIDTRAKKTFKKLAPILRRMGILTEADGYALGILCQIQSRLETLHRKIKKEKTLVQFGRHGEQSSVYTVMERQYYKLYRDFAGEFGLSPRGRTGLQVRGTDEHEGEDLLT